MTTIAQALQDTMGAEKVRVDVNMHTLTTFKTGGKADVVVDVTCEQDVISAYLLCKQTQTPYLVLGNGSNVLCKDGGFEGVIIHMGKGFAEIKMEKDLLWAQAGALLSTLFKKSLRYNKVGLEFCSGIPGTVGGAVLMNAGAYGHEIKDVCFSVKILSEEGIIKEIRSKDLGFGYRTSCLQQTGEIVLSAGFLLQTGDIEASKKTASAWDAQRREKQPLNYASAGSTFKRPTGHYAGALIEQAGLKGLTVGGAQVSEKHAGFIINQGNATGKDILNLIGEVQNRVFAQSGVRLETEIHIVGKE